MTQTTSTFLRRILLADGLISGATGLAMALGAGIFESLFGVPAPLWRYAGIVLLPFAAFVIFLWSRDRLPRRGVWTVIALNAAWVAGSVVLPLTGGIDPNTLGTAFILAQAVAVGALAEMQYVGLRRQAG